MKFKKSRNAEKDLKLKSLLSVTSFTREELASAEKDICRIVQKKEFGKLYYFYFDHRKKHWVKVPSEYRQLHKELNPLQPFCDRNGVIGVQGRLQNLDLHYNNKHPILLSKRSDFTRLVVVDTHVK